MLKKTKNETGSGLLVVRIDFSIINLFRTDYRLDRFLFSRLVSIKIDRGI